MDRKYWTALVTVFLSCMLMTGVALLVADHRSKVAIQESNRKWCGIIIGFDDEYDVNAPTTAAGRGIAERMNALRNEFECDKEVP